MTTSTATVLIPGTVVNQRYVIQEVRQYHDQYRRYLALDAAEQFCLITEFPIYSNDADLQLRLRNLFEQKTAPLLDLNHPQLPRFTAAFRDRDGFFLVQEPPQGMPYRQLLKLRCDMGKSLTEPEVIHLLSHLLPALQDLHQRKLIHCKISPDSIILPVPQPQSADALRAAVRHEVPMLVELGAVDGLARQLSALQTQRSPNDMAPIARLGYAPPEQVQTGRIYPHSDLYGLAVTCLELLTGQPPQKLLDSHTLTWSWQAHTSLSQPFEEILSRMLSWQPGDRYATAQEVLTAIQTMGPSFGLGSARTKAGLKELNVGSILSIESWTVDSFLHPRRRRNRVDPDRVDPTAQTIPAAEPSSTRRPRSPHRQPTHALGMLHPPAIAPQDEPQPSIQSIPAETSSIGQSQAPSTQGQSNRGQSAPWQAWLILSILGGSLAIAPLLFSLGTQSAYKAAMPESRAPWQLLPWLQARLTQNSNPNPSQTPADITEAPTEIDPSPDSNPAISETDGSDLATLELLNNDIPIPIYLSDSRPEQSLEGSLRILPSQTYFIVGQAGQRLTARLKASSAQLTVLDSEERPIGEKAPATADETSNGTSDASPDSNPDNNQWEGELVDGDRTLLRISGQGNYELQLSLSSTEE